MLRLTPLKETDSVQEILHEERIELLTKQIRRKFRFGQKTIGRLVSRLKLLSMQDLDLLFEDILDIKTLRELDEWIDEHAPEPVVNIN